MLIENDDVIPQRTARLPRPALAVDWMAGLERISRLVTVGAAAIAGAAATLRQMSLVELIKESSMVN